MSIAKNWFPFKEIEPDQRETILSYCGGLPPSSETIKPFYMHHGSTMLDHALTLRVGEVGVNISRSAHDEATAVRQCYMRGVLLYAGVLRTVTPLSKLPYRADVIRSIATDDANYTATRALETIERDSRSFCDLVELTRPALEASTSRLHQAVLIGAGVVHLITTETVARNEEDTDPVILEHPELADLEELFRESFE